jgi:hypothetical protein
MNTPRKVSQERTKGGMSRFGNAKRMARGNYQWIWECRRPDHHYLRGVERRQFGHIIHFAEHVRYQARVVFFNLNRGIPGEEYAYEKSISGSAVRLGVRLHNGSVEPKLKPALIGYSEDH